MKGTIEKQEHGKKQDANNDNGYTKPVITNEKGGEAAGGRENRKNVQDLLHGRKS